MKKDISAAQAAKALEKAEVAGPAWIARAEIAAQLLDDLRRVDNQRREAKKHIAQIVRASKTTLTLYRVQGWPRRVQRNRPNRGLIWIEERLSALAAGQSPNEPRHPHGRSNPDQPPQTEGRLYYERKITEGMTRKRAIRSLRRRISDNVFAHLLEDVRGQRAELEKDPGGQSGNVFSSSAAAAWGDPEYSIPIASARRRWRPALSVSPGTRCVHMCRQSLRARVSQDQCPY